MCRVRVLRTHGQVVEARVHGRCAEVVETCVQQDPEIALQKTRSLIREGNLSEQAGVLRHCVGDGQVIGAQVRIPIVAAHLRNVDQFKTCVEHERQQVLAVVDVQIEGHWRDTEFGCDRRHRELVDARLGDIRRGLNDDVAGEASPHARLVHRLR